MAVHSHIDMAVTFTFPAISIWESTPILILRGSSPRGPGHHRLYRQFYSNVPPNVPPSPSLLGEPARGLCPDNCPQGVYQQLKQQRGGQKNRRAELTASQPDGERTKERRTAGRWQQQGRRQPQYNHNRHGGRVSQSDSGKQQVRDSGVNVSNYWDPLVSQGNSKRVGYPTRR